MSSFLSKLSGGSSSEHSSANNSWIHRCLHFCFIGESGNVSLSLDDEFWFSFSLADSMTLYDNFSEREVIVSLKSNFPSSTGVD